jgi:hypothetical protein
MTEKIVSDKSKLFASTESTVHLIRVAPGSDEYLRIWVKEPTFMQLEKAQAKMINLSSGNDVSLEMDTLFRYLWDAFVDKTEPALASVEVLRLSPYVGNQIKEILPNPFDMGDDADLKESMDE